MNLAGSLFFIICLLGLLSATLLVINNRVAVKKPDPAKLSPYECGYDPVGSTRQKFSVSYFLVAILYLVFDSEILFVYPFAMSLSHISYFGFWIFIIFGVLLTVGFVYELGKGALKYAEKPSENTHSNSPLVPSLRYKKGNKRNAAYIKAHDDPKPRLNIDGQAPDQVPRFGVGDPISGNLK